MSPDRDLLGRLPEGGSAGDLFGQICILAALTKALAERGLSTQMEVHLDEERAEKASEAAQPARQSAQRLPPEDRAPDSGKVALDIRRDRNGTFDPMLITKYRRRLPGFDRKIASMHVRGDDDPQDPGASRGDPWCRGLARPDFRDHRRDHRRDHGGGRRLAEPPPWAPAIRSSSWARSGSISGPAGGREQGGLRRPRGSARRQAGRSGALVSCS